MSEITKYDKNFIVDTAIKKDDIVFYNIDENPFSVCGVFRDGEVYRRLPEEVGKQANPGVNWLNQATAGGRIRFKTNSQYVAINVEYKEVLKMGHFAYAGSIGFDLYKKYDGEERYIGSYVPPIEVNDKFENIIDYLCENNDETLYEYTIHMPLYSLPKKIHIGLQKGAKIEKCEDYAYDKPVVYYGSSITQGGCASRPGMAYTNIISRMLNVDHINLGFSGSAKAEDSIIEHISNLDMLAFVFDYDYNAPTVEHLRNTHEKMFNRIREKNPTLPIIMMPHPFFHPVVATWEKEREQVIKQTYENALKKGDKNVYFISGDELTKENNREGSVDGCHPTDYGFSSMAKVVGKVLKTILEKI